MFRLFHFIVSLLSVMCILISTQSNAQIDNDDLVQLSGIVFMEEGDDLIPIQLCNVYLAKSKRGTYTDYDGFFSIVARKGETVVFSSVGFQSVEYKIPDTLESDRLTLYQSMVEDTFLLPESVVFPWPSRKYFKQEFLALNVPNELEDIARKNLDPETLNELQAVTPRSGSENASYYLRQQANTYYYFGQAPPQNIFSPLAWGKFIKAWKEGKYKKKDK